VVCDVSGQEGPRLLYILQRWLPLVLTIRRKPLRTNIAQPAACRLITLHLHADDCS